MRIFLACPVRGVSPEYRAGLDAQVGSLEQEGHTVYYPPRDTDQADPVGLSICEQNREGIMVADVVYVAWDGNSQGTMFDLGMAFALRKPVYVLTGYMPPMTKGKSFQNMIYAWEEERC